MELQEPPERYFLLPSPLQAILQQVAPLQAAPQRVVPQERQLSRRQDSLGPRLGRQLRALGLPEQQQTLG